MISISQLYKPFYLDLENKDLIANVRGIQEDDLKNKYVTKWLRTWPLIAEKRYCFGCVVLTNLILDDDIQEKDIPKKEKKLFEEMDDKIEQMLKSLLKIN